MWSAAFVWVQVKIANFGFSSFSIHRNAHGIAYLHSSSDRCDYETETLLWVLRHRARGWQYLSWLPAFLSMQDVSYTTHGICRAGGIQPCLRYVVLC